MGCWHRAEFHLLLGNSEDCEPAVDLYRSVCGREDLSTEPRVQATYLRYFKHAEKILATARDDAELAERDEEEVEEEEEEEDVDLDNGEAESAGIFAKWEVMNESDDSIHGSEQELETSGDKSDGSNDAFDNSPQLPMSKQSDEDMRMSFKTMVYGVPSIAAAGRSRHSSRCATGTGDDSGQPSPSSSLHHT